MVVINIAKGTTNLGRSLATWIVEDEKPEVDNFGGD